MIDLRATGNWYESAIRIAWAPAARAIVADVERAIDLTWDRERARLGEKLFDGPMCRLERWSATPERLELVLSRTRYRTFLGTNLHNAHLADTFGREVLANPVGLSTALETADGWLLLGRRNDSVAYYPNRVHPFAGALEPAEELNVFDEVRRELREELALARDDLAEITCIGMAEDRCLRQPELIFRARTFRTRAQLEATLDAGEHHAVYPIRVHAADVARAVTDPLLTPIAVAAMLLWGGITFGSEWARSAGAGIV